MITKEKLDLAVEYRGVEKLCRNFVENGAYPFRAENMKFIYGHLINTSAGVPVECVENAILRMKCIRSKLRDVDKIFHVRVA